MIMQLAKSIFQMNLKIMKQILSLGEFKLGKKSEEYKYFKSQVMDSFYTGIGDLFKYFYDNKLIEKCSCKANIRNGYSDCPLCGGSGYKNNEKNHE